MEEFDGRRTPKPGQILSHYRIIEKIGEGGMGIVYRAHDTRLERNVALKVIPEGALADEDSRRRLRKEALTLSSLSHPNIETIHDFDTEKGVDFLVMEYLDGATLEAKLGFGPLGVKEVIRIGTQLAEGLAAAHSESVLHRDLKPGNVLVTNDGLVKLLDFGLAKHIRSVSVSSQKSTVSMANDVVGTPPYMSPEQLRGEGASERSDIFSLGSVLYELATGRRAFAGSVLPQVTDAILHQSPVSLRALRPEVHPELERIVFKCLAKEPEDRYQSAREIAADLRGLQSGKTVPAPPTWVPRRFFRPLLGALILSTAVLAGFLLWPPTRSTSTDPAEKLMLAVLPFDNLSNDPEQDYFSDGITEEMIAQLGRLQPHRLGVIARTSIMRYKGTDRSISQIGQELDLDYVIEGSVRREGNQVRVTAQLIQVSDETHVWANSYDGKLHQILVLQSEVAQAIAQEIHLQLTSEQKTGLRNPQTLDPQAYEAYLKGRYWWNRRSADAMQKGIEFFNQAIQADPSYAPAHAGLADSYLMLAAYDVLHPDDAFPKAKSAASRALEIDPYLAEAHASLAYALFLYDWDWNNAERGYRRALQLDPNLAMAHVWYGIFLAALGRGEEAVAEADLAMTLDPLSLIIGAMRAWVLYFTGDFSGSIEQCQETLELDQSFYPAHMIVARSYERIGMCEKAVQAVEAAAKLAQTPSMLPELAYTYGICGDEKKALQARKRIEDHFADSYFLPINMALAEMGLGNTDDALAWLEKATEGRYPWMVQLRVEPRWTVLQEDPRFEVLAERIGL